MNSVFVIEKADAYLDGGSIFLVLRDGDGRRHQVELVQSMFPVSPGSQRLRGRLYFDDELVAIRSEQERKLLAGLRDAIGFAPVTPAKELVEELFRVVESKHYENSGASERR